jgi:hypothetical protein
VLLEGSGGRRPEKSSCSSSEEASDAEVDDATPRMKAKSCSDIVADSSSGDGSEGAPGRNVVACFKACCAPSRVAFVSGVGVAHDCLLGIFAVDGAVLIGLLLDLTGVEVDFVVGACGPLFIDVSKIGGNGSRDLLLAAKLGVDFECTPRPRGRGCKPPRLCGGMVVCDIVVH